MLGAAPTDPLEFWRCLHPSPRLGFYFGSGAGTDNDHLIYMSVGEPQRSWRSDSPAALRVVQASRPNPNDPYPRFVGYIGFEGGRAFDPGIGRMRRCPNPLQTPTFLFGDYGATVQIDLQKKQTTLLWRGSSQTGFQRLLKRIQTVLAQDPAPSVHHVVYPKTELAKEDVMTARRFRSMVINAKAAIARGDIYQASLSLRFKRVYRGDAYSLYRKVCASNPSPYAALLACGDHWLVSNSPELLLQIKGRRAVSRPIAGTRARGKTVRADQQRRGQLLLSPKERAEHIMLVDLERNDLGRVCKAGSVKVTEQFSIERYSHVMHIVSQVEGTLRADRTATHALAALFPGGTITGCPKIRSIELIEEQEKISRGPFYGSAGFFSGNGDAIFNILIRTALLKDRQAWVQAGAGIVADSDPKREYLEVKAKAAALLEALEKS